MRRRLRSQRREKILKPSHSSTFLQVPSTDPLYTVYPTSRVHLFLIAFAGITMIFVLVLRYHRIDSLAAFQSVLDVASRPIVEHSPRCKVYNDSTSVRFRCLPNTFLIGASKCATTSLVSYLRNISNVHFVSRRIHARDHHSEVHRFDRNNFPTSFQRLELLEEWASSPLIEDVSSPVIHYTPHYIYAPMVPFEIRDFFPISKPHSLPRHDLKFIVLLRDPVARAFSSYWFKMSHLFRENGFLDKGSLEDFETKVNRDISLRVQYDACMDEKYFSRILDGKPFLDLNKSDFTYLFRIGTNKDMFLMLKESLKCCFGPNEVRSSKLGLRHVDKGIYVDQLYRWFMNFDSRSIIMEAIETWTDEINVNNSFLFSVQRILRFINAENNVMDQVEQSYHRNLHTPNKIWRDILTTLDKTKRAQERYQSSPVLSDIDKEKESIQMYFKIEKKLSDFYRPYNRLLFTMLHAIADESHEKLNSFRGLMSGITLWSSY